MDARPIFENSTACQKSMPLVIGLGLAFGLVWVWWLWLSIDATKHLIDASFMTLFGGSLRVVGCLLLFGVGGGL